MKPVYLALLSIASGAALMAQQTDVMMMTPGTPMGAGMGPGTFAFVSGALVGGSLVKGAPYSGEALTESTQTLADGNRIVNRTSAMVYRDGEGRERREQSIAMALFGSQATPHKMIFISDPVLGTNYSLNPDDKTAIKLPVPQIAPFPNPKMVPLPTGAAGVRGDVTFMVHTVGAAGPGGPPPPSGGQAPVMLFNRTTAAVGMPVPGNAPDAVQLGTKVVEGVQAEGTRTTITIPAGQIGNDKPIGIVDEVWRSPELQIIVHSEHNDPRMGSTTYSLKNISRSDPSPTLFQLPADYTLKDAPTFNTRIPPPQ